MSNHLAYQAGSLYWLAYRPNSKAELVRHVLSTGAETSILKGEIRAFEIVDDSAVVLLAESIVLVSLGSGEQQVLAENQADSAWLLIDSSHVYFGISDTRHVRIGKTHPGSIRRVALAGGPTETLAEDTGFGPVVVSGDALHWVHRGLQSIKKSSGKRRTLAFGGSASEKFQELGFGPLNLRAAHQELFVPHEGAAYRVSLEDGEVQKIYEDEIILDVIPIDADRVIVARNTSFAKGGISQVGAIVLVSQGKGEVLTECERPMSVAVAPGVVYYIDSPMDLASPAHIRSVAVPGSP